MALTEQKPPADLSSLRIHRESEKSGRPWGGLALAAVIALAVGVGAYLWLRGILSVKTVETVTASLVTEGQATTILSATGYVEADTKADLSPKITSNVVALYVTEGDKVRQGEILARLDKTDLDAQLADARATWANASATLKREQALTKQGLAPQSDLDAAIAAERSARAKIEFSEAQEQYTVIRAPFSGKVIAKRAHVGEAVSPYGAPGQGSTSGSAVLTLVDFSTLYVGTDINESNLARLAKKQPAEIFLDAYPDHAYHGYLLQIIPTADRAKGTVKVKVAFKDPDDNILPDMSARVNFTVSPTEGKKATSHVLVPKAAIVADGASSRVILVADGRAELRQVRTGAENQGQVEIVEGLQGGETLVSDAAHAELKNGQKVKVKGN